MTRYGTTGGVLSIISGGLGVFGALIVAVFLILAEGYFQFDTNLSGDLGDETWMILVVFYGITAAVIFLLGVLGIVGGIFALKRIHWGWALAGAIAGVFTFLPCGVAAVVLTSLARPEFVSPVRVSPPIA